MKEQFLVLPAVSKLKETETGFSLRRTNQSWNQTNHMKKAIITSALAAICIFFTGCASIVDGRAKTVRINSEPSGARVSIVDKKGKIVASETTPATIKLKRNRGYFMGEKYKLVFEAPGYYPSETYVQSTLNGWYLGNIVFGGAIGLLIVDPATGAMWTLSPREVNRNLVSSAVTLTPEQLKEAELKANPVKVLRPAPTGKGQPQP
jgi:hypothetical protein